MFCSHCGKNVGDLTICPDCGYDLINEVLPDAGQNAAQQPNPVEPAPAESAPVQQPEAFRAAPQEAYAPVPPQPYSSPYADPYQQKPDGNSYGYAPAPQEPSYTAPSYSRELEFGDGYDRPGVVPSVGDKGQPKQKKKKKGLIIGISAGIAVLLAGAVVLVLFLTADARDYSKAKGLMEDGQYAEALEIFTRLEDYEESQTLIPECQYLEAKQLLADKKYDEAIDMFLTLGLYKDSTNLITECRYEKAVDLYNNGKYDEAREILTGLGDYQDAASFITKCDYARATALYQSGKYEEARRIFDALDGYSDSGEMVKACDYGIAEGLIESDPAEAIEILEDLGSYQESEKLLKQAKMSYCESHNDNTDTDTYAYLKELKAANYPGAADLYDELYTYRIVDAFWNDDEDNDDPASGVTKLSTKKDQILHFTLRGGTPDDENMKIQYTVTWPSGNKSNDEFKSRAVYYTLTLENDVAGTLKVDLFTPDGKLLHTATVTVA